MTRHARDPGSRVLCGIGLVCFSNLLLEIVLTRIFSATMYYHFTFLAIALALFGMGASGVYVYVRSDRFTPERAIEDLSRASRRMAAATLLALVYVLANPINLGVGSSKAFSFSNQTFLQLVLLNGVAALPFFFSGIVVSLSVLHFRSRIGTVYFYDLTGAAAGALLCSFLLQVLGGPSLVLMIAVLAAVAGVMFVRPRNWTDWLPLAATAALLGVNLARPIIEIPSVKGVQATRTIFEKWNAFSRVTVERLDNGLLDIKIDASAATRVADGRTLNQRNWRQEITALAYSLGEGSGHALIIGPGGGPDVANALAAGVDHVTGVEVNPIISETIMQDRFLDESGALYRDPRVTIVTDEGRSFIRRSDQRYDFIQASLVDTWAATAAGAFALTENTLYTVEAFEDYFAHLSDRGVVTMSRWFGGRDPETARLLLLASAGLISTGVEPTKTRAHLLLAHKQGLATMLAKRTAFTGPEIQLLEAAARVGGFTIALSPVTDGQSELERLVDAGPYSAFVRGQSRDLSPPTDDRPFFFYFVKSGDLFNLRKQFGKRTELVNPAVWILLAFGLTIIALAVVFILLPLLLHRSNALRGGTRRDYLRRAITLAYFCLIGLAFITVEIALMQKLGLFLGHPSYGLIVVLFSLLIATAVGARLSERVPDRRRAIFALGAACLAALVSLTYAWLLSDMLRDWVAWTLILRIGLSGLLAGILGMVMGMMLPLGVRLVSDWDPEMIPWAWGVNGATSVMGTVVATILAIHVGFNQTLAVGAVTYILAGAAAYGLGRLVVLTPRA